MLQQAENRNQWASFGQDSSVKSPSTAMVNGYVKQRFPFLRLQIEF
ncbi:Uncharacterized protein APZ42_002272, partial [Daphnia magna]